jgi:hypothetical protein
VSSPHPFPFGERRCRPFLHDMLEVGTRAATYLSNEDEGWGPWVRVDLRVDLSRTVLRHNQWLPSPHPIPAQRVPA